MTGPPYPRPNPVPGSNAIGSFAIGVSPVGDIPEFDFWDTVISQYTNSPILTQLLDNFSQYIDLTADFDAFFDMVWNVDTAQGWGLDVWGTIVGVSRVVTLPGEAEYLGFQEANSWQPFNQAPFYSGETVNNNYTLTDDAYRLLILAKALANICDCSIPAINQLLLNLFPGLGNSFVTDGENMTMVYNFNFVLSPVQFAIVSNSGVLPRPAGVASTISQGLPR